MIKCYVCNMEIGDKVKTVGFFKGIEGVVTHVVKGTDSENHGTIEIMVTKSTRDHPIVGELEHFVHFDWKKNLKIL